MKSLDCAVCLHEERMLIERMLSRGESLSYLCERFPGLSLLVFRSHRDDHMDVLDATAFASPKHRLSDLQEARLMIQRIMEISSGSQTKKSGSQTKKGHGPMRPVILLHAISSLRGVLADIDETADKVRVVQVNEDAAVLTTVLKEVLARHQEALMDFNNTLQQKLLTVEKG